jgi:hypothetical protein
LILSPFSAPFSTCDFLTAFPGANPDARHRETRAAVASAAEAAANHAIPLRRVTPRIRFVAAWAGALSSTVTLPSAVTHATAVTTGFTRPLLASPLRI